MAEALTKAGRYQIVGELGRGSMGVVYQGFDPVIGRTVAIKTMLPEGLSSQEFEEYKARFQREAMAAGILAHPNIITVYDFGEDNGVLYLAMEYLEGQVAGKNRPGTARSCPSKRSCPFMTRSAAPLTMPTATRLFTATSSPPTS